MNTTPARARRRNLIAAVALIIALPVLVLAAAPLLVDRDAFRQRVELEMSAVLGAPVEVGAIDELRLLPTPRAVLGGLRVDASPPVLAGRVQLDLSLPALLLNRAEPFRLMATGIALSLPWPPTDQRPAWLAGLSSAAPQIDGGELTLDYPANSRRLRWPLFGANPGPVQPQVDAGPLRLAASLPLVLTGTRHQGRLRVDARIDPSGLPALEIVPLRIGAEDLDLGQPTDLDAVLTVDRTGRAADGSWSIDGFDLGAGALRLTGALGTGRGASGAVAAGGTFAIAPVDLRAWAAEHLGRPLPGDPDRLRCLAARGAFALDDGLIRLVPMEVRLDATRLGAAASVLLEPQPRLAANLWLDELDLDAYLAPPRTPSQNEGLPDLAEAAPCGPTEIWAETGIENGADTGALDAPPIEPGPEPGAGLRLDATAGALTLGGARFGELVVAVEQRGPLTEIAIESGIFYDGSLSAEIDHRRLQGGPAEHRLKAAANSVNLGPLLADVTGEATLSGSADMRAKLSARGSGSTELRRSLAGKFKLSLRDARSAALQRTAADFRPLLNMVGLRLEADTLELQQLKLTATGEDGVFQTDDIDGQGRLFHLGGDGRLDATAETLAVDLIATLVQPPDGPDLQGLDGIEVPIAVAGPWSAPGVDANLQPALAEAARRTAKRHLDGNGNLFEQLEEATGVKGLEQGLRGLLGF